MYRMTLYIITNVPTVRPSFFAKITARTSMPSIAPPLRMVRPLPTPEMIELAKESGIVLLSSKKRMYDACGILYTNGLVGNKLRS